MKKLRGEVFLWIGVAAAFIVVIALLLASAWEARYAARWLPLPVMAATYLFTVIFRNLSANHRHGERELLPGLGWGNRLTLLRGLLIGGMLGFVLLPHPLGWLSWIPGILYTLSDATDFFDGYVARVTHHTTRLGEILDMSFDGLGVLVASLLAVQYGKVPPWFIGIGLARYLYLAGFGLRRRLGLPVYDLPHSLSRRIFAGLLMGFLAAVLWPVFKPPGTHIAALLFGLPLVYGFTRDWLYVSGIIKPENLQPRSLGRAISLRLPVVMRLLILALSLPGINAWLQNFSELPAALAGLGLFNLLLVALLFFGIAPRIAAIAALCVLGLYQLFSPLTPTQITLAVAYTVILYMGSGAWSLWTPEDYLYRSHAGSRAAKEPKSVGFGRGA